MLRRIAWDRASDFELLDIVTQPATPEIWRRLFAWIADRDVTFTVDGDPKDLPASIGEVVAVRRNASPVLQIGVATARLDCFFHDETEVELVAASRELGDAATAEAVEAFMQGLADELGMVFTIHPEGRGPVILGRFTPLRQGR